MDSPTIFSLSYSATNASTGAHYSLTLTSGKVGTGSAQITPSAVAYTYISMQEALTIQAPPGTIGMGGPVTTDNELIEGQISVSPPIDVDTIVALRGSGGDVHATYILRAGETLGSFSFVAIPCGATEERQTDKPRRPVERQT